MKRIKIFMAAALTVVAIGGAVAAKVAYAPGQFYIQPTPGTYELIDTQACPTEGVNCLYEGYQVYKDFGTTGAPSYRTVKP